MLNSQKQDKKRRYTAKKLELKRLQNRVISQDISLSTDKIGKKRVLRYPLSTGTVRKGSLQLLTLPDSLKKGSIERTKNYCVLTGRSKGVFKFCKLSRISFRDMASKTLLNGVNKASW